jgi:hypothetical protein
LVSVFVLLLELVPKLAGFSSEINVFVLVVGVVCFHHNGKSSFDARMADDD